MGLTGVGAQSTGGSHRVWGADYICVCVHVPVAV